MPLFATLSADGIATRMWSKVKSLLGLKPLSEEEFRRQREEILEVTPVPVLWLFGKTGSGKTSIVRYFTGAEDAAIGSGFQPCTQYSRQYDFPAQESPIVRFLDTRGLGEAGYDAEVDIRQFDETAQVMIVTVRITDQALAPVLDSLKAIRKANPQRPVVLALTCLHDAYPFQQHPAEDPFLADAIPDSVPEDLQRLLKAHHERFKGLVDRIVPIDFTREEEGFDQPFFGGERLQETLIELLPAAYRQTLMNLEDVMSSLRSLSDQRATPYVLAYSTMAASAAAVPIPWIDVPVVTSLQSQMVYKLARIYGQPMRASLFLKMAGAVGGRIATRLAIRESLKVIPYVGMAANAALAFTYTYALGQACCWYFGQLGAGHAPSEEELRQTWERQLSTATELWKKYRSDQEKE